MSEPLQLRMATDQDAPMLAGMNARLIQDEGHRNPMTLPELTERMRRWLQQDYQAVVFERDGIPVAYALFCEGEQFGERFIFLRQFYVERGFRRQGIGRRAIDLLFCEVWPNTSRVLLDVLVQNAAGRAFWSAVGFKEHCMTLERLRVQ